MLSEKEVELFLAINEKRSISRAAEALHVAQPALSRSLHRLETELNAKLFDRTASPLSLTEAGGRYLAYAKRYMTLSTSLREEFDDIREQAQGSLSLGIPSQVATFIFPQVVASFLLKYSNLTVNMKYGTTKQLSEMLKNGKLHFSVLSSPLRQNGFCNDLIAYDKIILAIPTQYHVEPYLRCCSNEQAYIDFGKIADERFFVTESLYQSSVKALLDAIGASPSRITYVPSLNVAWDLACKGTGIAFIMQSMVRHGHITPAPIYCAIDAPESVLHFTLTYRESKLSGNPLLQLFVNHCRASFSEKLI
jgi:DNA-binding transcriptional LysR family regulator